MPNSQQSSWLTFMIVVSSVAVVAQISGLVLERRSAAEVPQVRRYEPGVPLADIKLLDARGAGISLSAVVGGDCRLLVFFLESCGHCKRMAASWGGRREIAGGIPVTWISVPGDAETVKQFAERYGLPEPVYRVSTSDDAAALGIYATPLPVLVGGRREYLGIESVYPDSIQPPAQCEAAERVEAS